MVRATLRMRLDDLSVPEAFEELLDWPDFYIIEYTWPVFQGQQIQFCIGIFFGKCFQASSIVRCDTIG